MRRLFSQDQRRWLISALLIALVVRALIPAGFMPATDRPFSFQICPDGYPAHLLKAAHDPHAAHQHHDDGAGDTHNHSSASFEHCVFAAAAGAGPFAFVPTLSAVAVSVGAPEFFLASASVESQRHRIQQPRGPPALS